MRTMTWRDLDFERHQDPPDWQAHWALGTRLAKTGWPWRASCINAYLQPGPEEQGLYWGLRVYDPAKGPEYRKTMLSVYIYEAVLDCGVRGVEDFLRWWQSRPHASRNST